MADYTAEHGLQVLTYLGLTCISDKEKEVFKEKWDQFYGGSSDLIRTTWTLYAEALPFICGDGDRDSFLLAQFRDSDFGKRVEATELEEKLKQGVTLEEILKKGPHKFYIRY